MPTSCAAIVGLHSWDSRRTARLPQGQAVPCGTVHDCSWGDHLPLAAACLQRLARRAQSLRRSYRDSSTSSMHNLCNLLTAGCLPAAGETIHPWQVLDGVVRGRTVVVLGTANEPMPEQSMAELSPHVREADVLVTSPAMQVSSLLLALLLLCRAAI